MRRQTQPSGAVNVAPRRLLDRDAQKPENSAFSSFVSHYRDPGAADTRSALFPVQVAGYFNQLGSPEPTPPIS